MKPYFALTVTLLSYQLLYSQDNCNVFLWKGDSCRYNACTFLEESPSYFQLTREYHEIKDQALEICPEYAVVYKHKSTAYLKTGDFVGWKKLIDQAVDLYPEENLDYRGWCRFQFFRDYQGAIDDIERLEDLVDYDIGFCQNGDYHLVIAKGLCYKMIGENEKAIEIIQGQIERDPSSVGLYDYLHLGVLYLENGEYDKALEAFSEQKKYYELAECLYYEAMVFKKLEQQAAYETSVQKAHALYTDSQHMIDTYTHHVDKVYLAEIEAELAQMDR